MYKRVLLEEWHQVVPYLCFGLIAGAFILIVILALTMKKDEVERLSRLPLRKDDHDKQG